jgi:hypothetical protein
VAAELQVAQKAALAAVELLVEQAVEALLAGQQVAVELHRSLKILGLLAQEPLEVLQELLAAEPTWEQVEQLEPPQAALRLELLLALRQEPLAPKRVLLALRLGQLLVEPEGLLARPAERLVQQLAQRRQMQVLVFQKVQLTTVMERTPLMA